MRPMTMPIRKIAYNPPKAPFIDIIFEDQDMLICNKQAGLLSVPGRGESMKDCLETRLKHEYNEIYTVHRLDMETSGLMVYARSKEMQRQLSQLFMDRKVQKKYIADIFGTAKAQEGSVDLPLICDWPNRPKQKVDHKNGKKAQTLWQVTNTQSDGRCRVLLTPITGRSHQLRVHMLELGHPILGDSLYAPDEAYTPYNRLHLHASELSFTHPNTGEELNFSSKADF